MDEEILKGKVLLVVDDEVDLRDIVASELEYMGAKVFQAGNISDAQECLTKHAIDLIISDIRMPGGTGVDLLDRVKENNTKAPPVILITGFADVTLEDAFNKGAEALLNKPFKLDDLIKMVVRHTLPFEQRFSESVSPVKTIAVENTPKIGRGGFSLQLSADGKRFESGEIVEFKFDYMNKSISGAGTLRWVKPSEKEPNKLLVGLEFMNLDPGSLNALGALNAAKTPIAYIPSSL